MTDETSNFHFKLMSLSFKIRDFLQPRKKILEEVGIKEGFKVLDFGCGPGSYIEPLAEMVGPQGKIYALDINPLALKKVEKLALRKKLKNVITILSKDKIELSDSCLDLVLLYDTLHELAKPDDVLKEVYRVLKPEGRLSVSDHHLKEEDIVAAIARNGWFQFVGKRPKTYSFLKV